MNPHYYEENPILTALSVPVGEVCPVQTSSVEDKAPLAVPHTIMDLLLGRVVRHAAAGSVPGVGAVGWQTHLLNGSLSTRSLSGLLQVRGLRRRLEHKVSLCSSMKQREQSDKKVIKRRKLEA